MVFLVIVTSWAWAPLENIFVTITSPLLWISPAFYLFLIITAQSRRKHSGVKWSLVCLNTWQPIKESDYVPAWCRLCFTKPYAHCTCSSDFFKSSTKFLRHSTLLMWQCLASKIYRRLVRSNPFVCLTVRFLSSNSQHSEEMEAHYVISSFAALFVSKPNQETIQFLQRHTSRHQKLHWLAIQTFTLLCFIKHYSWWPKIECDWTFVSFQGMRC